MFDERLILKNGIELCIKKMPEKYSSSVGIWIKEGARHEPENVKGIAHFLEHLLFKGSKNYNYKKIKQEIEGRGGQLNGFTSQEVTCYYGRVLNKNVELTVDILLDMVAFPLLKESDIERERNVICEEIKMYEDIPSSKVGVISDKLLWPSDPLGIDVIGSEASVNATTKKDLIDFQKKFYRPSNIIVTICGACPDKVLQIIENKISTQAKEAKSVEKKLKVSKGRAFGKEIKQFNQTHLQLSFPGVDYFSKDRYPLDVLNTVLGANMSSRLFEALREKRGLVYDVGTSCRRYSNTGCFSVHCGLEASNVEKSISIIKTELDKIKSKPVASAELKRAKDYILGNILINFESSLNTMMYLGESLATKGKVTDIEEIKDNFLKVSAEEIMQAASKYLDYNSLKFAVVSNQENVVTEETVNKIFI